MSHARGTSILLLVILACLSFACARERATAPPRQRGGELVQEIWFQNAFRFLADLKGKLADPVARTEFRLHLLAGDAGWAYRRLGYSREELGAFLAKQELLRAGTQFRWPELEDLELPPEPTDPAGDLLARLGSKEWPVGSPASSKEFYTCAIVAFFAEFNRCTLLQGEIYATIGCVLDAYLRFLESLSRGC